MQPITIGTAPPVSFLNMEHPSFVPIEIQPSPAPLLLAARRTWLDASSASAGAVPPPSAAADFSRYEPFGAIGNAVVAEAAAVPLEDLGLAAKNSAAAAKARPRISPTTTDTQSRAMDLEDFVFFALKSNLYVDSHWRTETWIFQGLSLPALSELCRERSR
jgi:hypothetical protein